jgi:hypothetical protein
MYFFQEQFLLKLRIVIIIDVKQFSLVITILSIIQYVALLWRIRHRNTIHRLFVNWHILYAVLYFFLWLMVVQVNELDMIDPQLVPAFSPNMVSIIRDYPFNLFYQCMCGITNVYLYPYTDTTRLGIAVSNTTPLFSYYLDTRIIPGDVKPHASVQE